MSQPAPEPMPSRTIHARYVDPLSHIWLAAAAELRLRVARDGRGYATTDGAGRLTIAPEGDLDADDCLGQIILHELCHWLVQGEASYDRPDWGLDNDAQSAAYAGDTVREQACLRVQAALLRPYGLRGLLGPTTDFRLFYDRLPADPLDGEPGDPALPLARDGVARAGQAPFRRPLAAALRATAALHQALATASPAGYATEAALGSPALALPPIWRLHPPRSRHPSGLPMHDGQHPAPAATCRSCVFVTAPVRGRGPFRCSFAAAGGDPDAAAARPAVPPDTPACALYRATLDCQACAACCRHAYDLVPVGRREPAVRRHPDLIESKGRRLYILRDPAARRCGALSGPPAGPWACTIYDDRPATCRDFTAGSTSCVDARRRVGVEWSQVP